MKNNPINVFIIDDEFPKIPEFIRSGVYNSAVSTDDLYHLAIESEWSHLVHLQNLIKDIVTSQASKEGLIELTGFSSPTIALTHIGKGVIPDVIIYDWEYPNAPVHSLNSRRWLKELLETTESFVFVYSKMRDQLPQYLNISELTQHSNRFQLFLKGGKLKDSFSAEEFIYQYIIGAATNKGQIKINGIEVEFTSNDFLKNASDLLYLQRILGKKYILDKLSNVDFSLNNASVEKILNDSERYLFFNESENILYDPEIAEGRLDPNSIVKMSYLEVAKKFSLRTLESVLERGIVPII